jgi:homoserine dehydrogenase
MKQTKIGLIGFGVVGEGVYHVVSQTPSLLACIHKIAIKQSNKTRNAPAHLFTNNVEDLLEDESIDIIVELIDDADAAYVYVTKAIRNGKHVVSANKKMIANHLPELKKLQHEYNVSFLYEASVAGSIPIIRNLEEYYDNDFLKAFTGIVNGSTNFILTQMNENKLSYTDAVTLAQKEGFAESNPALDVEGIDACNKLCILLQHTFGLNTNPNNLLHAGITHLQPSDAAFANKKNFTIKLLARATCAANNDIHAFVLPHFVPNSHALSHVRNEYNGVLLSSTLSDQQFMVGKGAGRYPTSSAVLSDISSLRYQYKYEYRKSKSNTTYHLENNFTIKLYVNYTHCENPISSHAFSQVYEKLESVNRQYIIGDISIQHLKELDWLSNPNISIIAFYDEFK